MHLASLGVWTLLWFADSWGCVVAQAQELHTPITSIDKFLQSDHVIYLLCTDDDDGTLPIGLLRTGVKHLFAYVSLCCC